MALSVRRLKNIRLSENTPAAPTPTSATHNHIQPPGSHQIPNTPIKLNSAIVSAKGCWLAIFSASMVTANTAGSPTHCKIEPYQPASVGVMPLLIKMAGSQLAKV